MSKSAAARRRRRLAGVLAGLVLVAALGAVAVVLRPGTIVMQPGAWSSQRIAAAHAVTDATGVTWTPDPGLVGGTTVAVDTSTLTGTASPQLYATARVGVTAWSVTVPHPSRYAIDLLIPPPLPGTSRGQNVFDVLAADGSGTVVPLRRGVDPAAWTPGAAQHVTGMVNIASTRLTLLLQRVTGQTAVTGLSVTSAPASAPRTLLADTFDGPAGGALPARWHREVGSGPWGPTELEGYSADPAHSQLDGQGHLALVATRDPYVDAAGQRSYTSARLDTQGSVSITYGRIEARLQPPAGPGMWSALWALGTNKPQVDWPRSGEIDVAELLGGAPSTAFAHVHALGDQHDPLGWKQQPVSSYGIGYPAGQDLTTGMHSYAVDIQPDAVTFSLDDRPYYVLTRADLRIGQQWPIGHPFYLVLDLAVGGWEGQPQASTMFPGRLLVDDVHVTGWQQG